MAKIPWVTTKVQALSFGAQIVFGLFGGAAVLTALTGIAQKILGLPLDWSILVLVFLLGVILMWWSSRALAINVSSRTGEKSAASQVHLKPNQIIYPSPPSKNGVLWEWEAGQYGSGRLLGPSCPTHLVRLLYWPVNGLVDRVEHYKEDDYLSSNGSFVCPIDNEEFTFIRLKGMKIGALRTQALAQFQAEQQRKQVTEK